MPTGKRVFVSLALVLTVILIIGMLAPALVFGLSLFTTKLTFNDTQDINAQISGNNIVWMGHDGSDYEIILFDGSNVTTLTDNDFDDQSPQIDGNKIVWEDSAHRRIFLYDGSEVTTITESHSQYSPQISGDNVVWYGHDGSGDHEIFFYDGLNVTTLTDNTISDYAPQISGDNVVWYGYDGNDQEIFFYHDSSVTTLTGDDYDDYWPEIDGTNIVWTGAPVGGGDYEIFLYDGSSVTTLTDNDYDDHFPRVAGNRVAWYGGHRGDWEVFLYDGSNVTTLTDNSEDDYGVELSESYVVWHGGVWQAGIFNYDAFVYDGSSVTTLREPYGDGPRVVAIQDEVGPKVSGNKAVWQVGPKRNREIWMATLGANTPPSDSTVTVEPSPGVIVEFDGVIEGGMTEVTTSTTPNSGPPIGFRFRGNEFNITTDASFTPPIQITIPYDDSGMNERAEGSLKLFHHDGNNWVDVTVSVDTVNNTITGEVSSLSPFIVGEEVASATVDIDPGTLNMKSKGGYVTAYLSVPTEYSVADIELNHISLYGRSYGPDQHVHAETFPIELGDDSDGDGKPDYLMVKFDRYDVQEIAGDPGDVELTVNFQLNGNTYEGSDTIKVIEKGKVHYDSIDPASVEY